MIGYKREQVEDIGASVHGLMRESDDWFRDWGTQKSPAPVVLLDRPCGKYWETWMRFLTERLLKFGFISEEDFAFFKIKHSAQDAAAEITQFYKVFHSARRVGERFVIRLNRSLSNEAIVDLNNHFTDILRRGRDCPARCTSERKR